MLDELYAEYQIPTSEYLPDYDITLGIDTTKLPKTQSKINWEILKFRSEEDYGWKWSRLSKGKEWGDQEGERQNRWSDMLKILMLQEGFPWSPYP